jgi:phosphonoacetaldehyde hydrolase
VILDNSKDIKLASYFDSIVSCDDPNIKRGRPYPDGVWENMKQMGTESNFDCIKVDDTQAGILEGQSAGVWTVGVSKYNNYVGTQVQTMEALMALENQPCKKQYHQLMEESRQHLWEAKPSYVLDSLVDLPAIIAKLNLGMKMSHRK